MGDKTCRVGVVSRQECAAPVRDIPDILPDGAAGKKHALEKRGTTTTTTLQSVVEGRILNVAEVLPRFGRHGRRRRNKFKDVTAEVNSPLLRSIGRSRNGLNNPELAGTSSKLLGGSAGC